MAKLRNLLNYSVIADFFNISACSPGCPQIFVPLHTQQSEWDIIRGRALALGKQLAGTTVESISYRRGTEERHENEKLEEAGYKEIRDETSRAGKAP
jgi:hypothetical protein